MSKREELEKTLNELHQQLQETDSIDAELEGELNHLIQDITALLQKGDLEEDGLRARVKDAIGKFEASYPKLHNLMTQLSETLSEMGI